MFLRVFFEDGPMLGVLPISGKFRDQCRPSFLCEFKRELSARFHDPWETMRNAVEMRSTEPYGVALIDMSRSAPVTLTELVRRQPGRRGCLCIVGPISNCSKVAGTSTPSWRPPNGQPEENNKLKQP